MNANPCLYAMFVIGPNWLNSSLSCAGDRVVDVAHVGMAAARVAALVRHIAHEEPTCGREVRRGAEGG